jgi:hypothetical protein
MEFTQTEVTRFWLHVNKTTEDDCWEFKTYSKNNIYGSFKLGHRTYHAARLAYIFTFGQIEDSKIFVCHKCDNPPCCNPNHLFLGTAKDNNRDMALKGRTSQKVTISQAEEIIQLYKTGRYTQDQLAAIYNCDQTSISLYLKRSRVGLYNPNTQQRAKRIDLTKHEPEIIELYKTGYYTQKQLATIYHCSQTGIHDLLKRNNQTFAQQTSSFKELRPDSHRPTSKSGQDINSFTGRMGRTSPDNGDNQLLTA